MKKFRQGDEVSLKGMIEYDYGSDYVRVSFSPGGTEMIRREVVTLIRPRLEVGDMVSDGNKRGTVLALHANDFATMQQSGFFRPVVVSTSALTRLDPEPEPAPDIEEAPETPPSAEAIDQHLHGDGDEPDVDLMRDDRIERDMLAAKDAPIDF